MNLFTTKTFWAGIASIATGIGFAFGGDVPQGVQMVITGFVAIFLRDSIVTFTRLTIGMSKR